MTTISGSAPVTSSTGKLYVLQGEKAQALKNKLGGFGLSHYSHKPSRIGDTASKHLAGFVGDDTIATTKRGSGWDIRELPDNRYLVAVGDETQRLRTYISGQDVQARAENPQGAIEIMQQNLQDQLEKNLTGKPTRREEQLQRWADTYLTQVCFEEGTGQGKPGDRVKFLA